MKNILIENITPEDTLDIRHRVLWPNKPKEHCIVAGDQGAKHFGAFLNNVLVGVASTYELEGAVRLRKFAVENQHQSKGIGSELFKHALGHAVKSNATVFWCDARENAVEFYRQFGLSAEGSRFFKSDIPYLKMSIKL